MNRRAFLRKSLLAAAGAACSRVSGADWISPYAPASVYRVKLLNRDSSDGWAIASGCAVNNALLRLQHTHTTNLCPSSFPEMQDALSNAIGESPPVFLLLDLTAPCALNDPSIGAAIERTAGRSSCWLVGAPDQTQPEYRNLLGRLDARCGRVVHVARERPGDALHEPEVAAISFWGRCPTLLNRQADGRWFDSQSNIGVALLAPWNQDHERMSVEQKRLTGRVSGARYCYCDDVAWHLDACGDEHALHPDERAGEPPLPGGAGYTDDKLDAWDRRCDSLMDRRLHVFTCLFGEQNDLAPESR